VELGLGGVGDTATGRDFYRSVVQTLRPWRAPAPTLPPQEPDAVEGVNGPTTSKPEASTAGEALAKDANVAYPGRAIQTDAEAPVGESGTRRRDR